MHTPCRGYWPTPESFFGEKTRDFDPWKAVEKRVNGEDGGFLTLHERSRYKGPFAFTRTMRQ